MECKEGTENRSIKEVAYEGQNIIKFGSVALG